MKLTPNQIKDLNRMSKMLGFNFNLGDYFGQFNDLLDKLDNDTGVTDTDYKDLEAGK